MISMMTSLPVSRADRRISPTGSLPAATRSSWVSSMPWSMELRTMCMMGSPMLSTMVLSTSVFSPTRVSLQGRLSFLVMSRTIRVIFWNTLDTGTIRRDMDTSWSSSVSLRSWRADLEKASRFSPFRSGEEVTMDSVMTISPTTADS